MICFCKTNITRVFMNYYKKDALIIKQMYIYFITVFIFEVDNKLNKKCINPLMYKNKYLPSKTRYFISIGNRYE